MKAFVVFLLFVTNSSRADIIGGETVTPVDPIQSTTAALFSPSPDGHSGALCTASILGRDSALTAAHCVSSKGQKPVLIFGNDVHSASTEKRRVTRVAVNPRWDAAQGQGMDQGDIALVKFQGGLPAGYRPVAMMPSGQDVRSGEPVVLAGYGIANAAQKSGSGVLRKTTVTVDQPRAKKSEMILDQSHGKGACHGDSGGPAYVKRAGKTVLAGVTNRSYPASAPDDCAHQVVYTKVNAYQKWIAQTEQRFHSSSSEDNNLKSKSRLSGQKRPLDPSQAAQTTRSLNARLARRLPRRSLAKAMVRTQKKAVLMRKPKVFGKAPVKRKLAFRTKTRARVARTG